MSDILPPPDPATLAGLHSAHRNESIAAAFAASAGITALAGAACGLVWGGVGGRIAMRIVVSASGEHVRGLTSDDGFEIGAVSGATVFLLIFTTIPGGIAGLGLGIVRMVTSGPTWVVALGTGVATAALGGAAIAHTDGVAFRLLGPLRLTAWLFVLIPGLWGASAVVVAERLLRSRHLTVHVRRHSRGAIGWFLLAVVAIVGTRDLVSDVTTLT